MSDTITSEELIKTLSRIDVSLIIRHDTAENINSKDPAKIGSYVMLKGELILNTSNGCYRIGDGRHKVSELKEYGQKTSNTSVTINTFKLSDLLETTITEEFIQSVKNEGKFIVAYQNLEVVKYSISWLLNDDNTVIVPDTSIMYYVDGELYYWDAVDGIYAKKDIETELTLGRLTTEDYIQAKHIYNMKFYDDNGNLLDKQLSDDDIDYIILDCNE